MLLCMLSVHELLLWGHGMMLWIMDMQGLLLWILGVKGFCC
jgi:hypothetical protein